MKRKFTLFVAPLLCGFTGFPQSYCTFTSAPYAASQPGIIGFSLAASTRTSANIEGNNALVITNQTVNLFIGQPYSFTLTSTNDQVFGAPLTGAEQAVRMYIDYNADFDFADAGETAYSFDYVTFTPPNAPSATHVSSVITVPSTVTPGTAHMRVTAKMGPSAGHTPPTACNTPSDPGGYHGEMEDYVVVFSAGTVATSSFSAESSACTSVAVTMTNNSTGSPAPNFIWSTNPAASISGTSAATPSITFNTVGIYTITLKAGNIGSMSTSTRTISVSVCSGISELTGNAVNVSLAPDPFNQTSTLKYDLNNTSRTSVSVYNLLGEKVCNVLNEDQEPGPHEVIIDKTQFAKGSPGIYFIQLSSGNSVYRQKIIIAD